MKIKLDITNPVKSWIREYLYTWGYFVGLWIGWISDSPVTMHADQIWQPDNFRYGHFRPANRL